MAEETTGKMLFNGRKKIYSDYTDINRDNVVAFLNEVIPVFHGNISAIEYLYHYYKGEQPILKREKEIRPEINNKIVENRAQEIVNFNAGYIGGEPIQYISRGNEDISDALNELNSMMVAESKAAKDKQVIEWDMICGTAYKMVLPSGDKEVPFKIYIPDPRRACVVYSSFIGEEPIAGIYCTKLRNGEVIYSIYTKNRFFEVKENTVIKEDAHILGAIPIIEYPSNNARMGAFETVLPLLDALNLLDSNRLDGVEQFVQSLLILYNCQLPEGMTASKIKEYGLIELKQIGDNKADIKELVEQLNQTETQTLKDDLYQSVLSIVGMPSQGGANKSDSSNNGAVILRNGWQGAETRAKAFELTFKQSEREFLKLILRMAEKYIQINVKDIDYKFTRRAYEDILSKSQVLTTMLASEKIHPSLAFNASGLFIDPEEAYVKSMKWYEENQKKAEEMAQEIANGAELSEEDRRTQSDDERGNRQSDGQEETEGKAV